MMKEDLLLKLRNGEKLQLSQQLKLVAQLSIPAILAQISSIIMQYIDASMVGQLGANESAAIGLVSSSTWLFGNLCLAAVTGFTVLVSHRIGAKDNRTARSIMKQAFVVTIGIAILIAAIGAAISGGLPSWLGGEPEICRDATWYFLIYVLTLPFSQLNSISGGMLQASGNIRVPSILNVIMCALDVIFNTLLIFPSHRVLGILIPGADLGVAGAALGTSLAQIVTSIIMTVYLLTRCPALHLRRGEPLRFHREHLLQSIKITIPVAVEYAVMSVAQIVSTKIVAPLGTVSIAANSFAVTAESLCYMPGYGISSAAATLIGQSIGAKRSDLVKRLGWLTTLLGMAVMTITGGLMYFSAPLMMKMLSRDAEVIALGITVLHIEAFAEPLYGASIVASGVFRGAGDTLGPSLLNFCSMWIIRLPIAYVLSTHIGLKGVWIAMCIELCVRGILFLIRLWRGKYSKKLDTTNSAAVHA